MTDKSSTILSIVSLLLILVVLFIAIGDMRNAPIRKPFASGQTSDLSRSPLIVKDDSMELIDVVTNDLTTEDISLNTEADVVDESIELFPQNVQSGAKQSLTAGINSEKLSQAGYRSFTIKPRPFNGILFDSFDVSILKHLDVVDKTVLQFQNGNEHEVLRVYQFSFDSVDGSRETYEYLLLNLKNELGISLNETNQFGMSSFFINFSSPKDAAFLVVKTRNNVYALTYPKDVTDARGNYELVKKLLSEIQ